MGRFNIQRPIGNLWINFNSNFQSSEKCNAEIQRNIIKDNKGSRFQIRKILIAKERYTKLNNRNP